MTQTCSTCRSRKVRCDGVHPICGPCSRARRSVTCSYVNSPSEVTRGPLLQKGNACYACRRKKKKCDARRPFCTTCEVAGKQDECQYEENVQRNLTESLMARNRALEERIAELERQQGSYSAATEQRNQASPLATAHVLDLLSNPGSMSAQSWIPFLPNLSTLPDLTCPSILNNLDFAFQVTEHASSTEIVSPGATLIGYSSIQQLSEFRMTFLNHHGQLGISFPEPKMRAIMNGDLSGTYAHPVLIHVAQLMGCRLWQDQHRMNLNGTIENIQLQLTNRALLENPDPVTKLQVHSVLAIYFLIKRMMHEGRDQLVKGAQVAAEFRMRFDMLVAGGLPSLQDEPDVAQEHICALSQLMYLDKAATIVLNDPSLLGADYDQQFRTLPYVFPTISKNNLVVLRARSVDFLHRSRQLAARWMELILSIGATQVGSTSDAQMHWYEEYWELLEDVSDHIGHLSPMLLKTGFFRQREFALALRMCLIVSLTAAAELHRLLANHHTESRLKSINVILEIVALTKGLQDEDYIFLDPILGVCWSMVAIVLNQERMCPIDASSSVEWKSSFTVIRYSAHKLGHTLPFMENSVESINGVAVDSEGPSGSFE
ncbi:uncharacterized protein LAESUDRAFT_740887 [Laetiporus sulphureus 93-53]|uniref:Zn(2)-C6 fungal-type domain-containing protein n=1 Tax=Laetiporus sulphureus 93-53 TaxID=1314785 RepID=A0A165H7W3_9APHY|nr:uncharacterized protein LAESUDRAFT_740887 [Laetiporus sulphureus 93-53]KZT11368.1 hypothetical protein LAESUDRAFT_740887 [Laetiporus sulphureus 93-53]